VGFEKGFWILRGRDNHEVRARGGRQHWVGEAANVLSVNARGGTVMLEGKLCVGDLIDIHIVFY
jgi:hypothetical protein